MIIGQGLTFWATLDVKANSVVLAHKNVGGPVDDE